MVKMSKVTTYYISYKAAQNNSINIKNKQHNAMIKLQLTWLIVNKVPTSPGSSANLIMLKKLCHKSKEKM